MTLTGAVLLFSFHYWSVSFYLEHQSYLVKATGLTDMHKVSFNKHLLKGGPSRQTGLKGGNPWHHIETPFSLIFQPCNNHTMFVGVLWINFKRHEMLLYNNHLIMFIEGFKAAISQHVNNMYHFSVCFKKEKEKNYGFQIDGKHFFFLLLKIFVATYFQSLPITLHSI